MRGYARIRAVQILTLLWVLLPGTPAKATDPLGPLVEVLRSPCRVQKLSQAYYELLAPPSALSVSTEAPETAVLERIQKKLTPAQNRDFRNWYEAHFFYDRALFLPDLAKPSTEAWPTQFDQAGERPLDGYLSAKQALSGSDPLAWDLNTLHLVQKKLMSKESIRASQWEVLNRDFHLKRNSEGAPDPTLGRFRSSRIGFEVSHGVEAPPGKATLGTESIRRIVNDEPLRSSPKNLSELSLQNSFIGKNSQGNWVENLPLSQWRRYQSRLSRKVVDQLRQLLPDSESPVNDADPRLNTIRNQVINDLMQSSLHSLKNDLRRARSRDQVIVATARFYHELISIHPYENGNGRTARLLTEKILNRYGIPSPIWTHFGEDFLVSLSDFTDLLRDSVALSEKFHRDLEILTSAEGAGMDYRLTPIGHLTSGHDSVVSEEFWTWWNHKNKSRNLDADPLFEFQRWKKSQTYHMDLSADHSAPPPGIRLVTPLFSRTFGKLSRSQAAFDLKMREFYSPQQSLYRGAVAEGTFSDEEIVSMFAQLNPSTLGNGTPDHPTEQQLNRIFDEFNRQLVNDSEQVYQRVRAHAYPEVRVKRGPYTYENSQLISFSTRRDLADDFSNPRKMKEKDPTKLSGIRIQVRNREQGSIQTAERTDEWVRLRKQKLFAAQPGIGWEKEVVLLGGVDPESVIEIVVHDPNPDLTSGKSGFSRTATRIDYNHVRITEFSEGVKSGESLYEIRPSGRVVKVK